MKECSELATIQTYKPFDIVYGKDKDRVSPVHIVLSGRCSIIQYLNMNVGFANNLRISLVHPMKLFFYYYYIFIQTIFDCDV